MGKRPDQYQIDVGEGGATDYKNIPQTGRGHSDLDDTVEGDKQRLAQGQTEAKRGETQAKGGQPFPPDVPAPSADTRRGTKESSEQAED